MPAKKLKKMIPVPSFEIASSSTKVVNLWEAPLKFNRFIVSTGSVIETRIPNVKAPLHDISDTIHLNITAEIKAVTSITGTARTNTYENIYTK